MTPLSARARLGKGGPRTAAGKARSSRNALRHGLAAASDAALAATRDRVEPVVVAMAAAILADDPCLSPGPAGCPATTSHVDAEALRHAALDVAVAELELRRVRAAQAAMIETEDAARALEREIAILLGADGAHVAVVAGTSARPSFASEGPTFGDLLVATGGGRLASLERYHLRALARLHRARMAFEHIRARTRAGQRRPGQARSS